MNKLRFIILVVSVANVLGLTTDDYYWRDYDGQLPRDALPGGQDEYGKPLYIGQVLFEQKLIPGKIYENNDNVYFPWGHEQKRSENVKILCTPYPEVFEWITTKHDQIHRLVNNTLLFKGGFENGYSTYIGRKYVAGELTIGRVMCHTANMNCLGLYTARSGAQKLHTGEFEILTYNLYTGLIRKNLNCTLDVRHQ